jgi:DNA-binding response OmpR family regulator
MSKILLVEDDLDLLKRVGDWLEFEKYTVERSSLGSDALEKLLFYSYDLVILDWMLPGITGIEILSKFRDKGGVTPILMLTGKDKIEEIETGLDTGADDYLTKPFNLRELSARVRTLIRKKSGVYGQTLKVKDIVLDATAHKVTKNGVEIKLQPKEFAILEYLLRHPNDVFSIELLLQRIWPSESESTAETVRVCIARLRNKIDSPEDDSIIRTVTRIGYQLNQG